MFKPRPFILTFAFIALGACSSDDGAKQTEVSKAALCEFTQKNTETTRIAYVKWTGGLYNTELDVAEYQEKGVTSIFSALARPKNKRFQANERKDCYDDVKKIYYPCHVKVDVDLTKLSSIGRAEDAANAQFTAKYNCERMAVKAAHDAAQTGLVESNAFECEIIESRSCPIPKKAEAPKPDAPKTQDKPKPQGG